MSDISYQILGSDMQYVEVTLAPHAAIIGEQGAMMYMDNHIDVDTVLGDGSASRFGMMGRFVNALKRSSTGEALFSSRYRNQTANPLRVSFAAPTVGKIIAINLSEIGGELICQKGAFLAAEEGTKVQLAFQKRLRVGFLGGEGFIMQRIVGKGIVFINATGALSMQQLAPAQTLQVDSGCLVALSSAVTYDIHYAGKLKTALFGGEGLFYASLTGPGTVWLQSLPMQRLGAELMAAAVAGRNRRGLGGKLYLVIVIIIAVLTFLGEMGG
ncbi:AIM24 family protein [Agitococcus lubricus]|uniref:Uncharacterized protein (TIGR00266 family) n=1 Tax=Agitococcus lubricus TaxID=1077255 RepID=A0A2T5J318_9GAMM|nr:AIM24 family protein [Agitococcus lubricus]PTQ90966.1 uncharacterized protein (TIGR00266 family) [Agitococcus lubricus]